ncbi:putative porin [Sphingomonas sp. LT1P40]|uniref:putative porin n=1 Tax=Alteristakelama amylovorans TaxID=3096166 RepID=UPI002FCCA383
MRLRFLFLAVTAFTFPVAAHADDTRLEALERQLAAQQQRIAQLEVMVTEQAALLKQVSAPATTSPTPPRAVAVASVPAPAARVPGLDVSGDLRVRQEWNFGGARDRSRSVLRARLRASYAVTGNLTIGTQIATGDPDDPNSTDVTLGNFVDDLNVSLDQAWLRYTTGSLTAWAGKFPLPFQRTDMVWDGDVSPQGAALTVTAPAGAVKLDARALYLVIDEAPTARDSDMLGGQIAAAAPLGSDLKFTLAGSYYHYRLGSVAGADAGDFRGNRIAAGRYLSDFHLVEGLATLGWSGPSAHWPVTLTADYVRNLGATVPADTGFNVELAAGRTAQPGDWRVAYNYSDVEVDAVFAAFSHDNIDLSTNYRLHGLGVAYIPARDLQLDLALYHYRPLDPVYAGGATDWLNRVRLNFMVNF